MEDVRLPVSSMCDRSKIAIQSIKGKFDRCIALYDDNHRKALIEEQEISSQMHKALENGEFIPYYQPKYNLCTGEIVGAEALVRWIHPTKGVIPPQNFIQLFEKNGFISSVDFYMWECVCKYLNGVIQAGKTPLPVSVNVSRVDVYNPNLCDFLQGLVKKYNISPDLLELEITENSYIENAEELIKTINDLKALGFTIEMDDFGSGYSSLNMLSDVPVDVIKLDMRFLQSKNAFSGQKNILSFIVSLANWMDVQTVAEGIETVEQVEFLRSLGYAKGQGYYFAKPMPQAEYEQLLEKNEVLDVGNNNPIIFSKLLSYNEIWNPVSQFSVIFKGFVASMAIWEVSDGKIKFMRGNDRMLNAAKAYTGSDTYIYLKDVTEFICEEFLRLVGETCKANTYAITENRWMCPLKKNLWVNSRISVIFNDGTKAVLMVELTDVTRQKQLEEMSAQANADLQKHSNFFEQIYDSIPCGIAQFDYEKQETHFKNLNSAMVKILGYSSKKEFWEDNCDFIKLMSQETLAEIKHKLKRLEDKPLGTPVMVEYQLVGEKCGTIWVKAYTQLILDMDGRLTNQCVFIDITETRSKMESLNRKASKDPLTGLYNRAVFQTAVTAFIEETV
ncbi:MAG: EAL domain-containing protein, partial [Oscillospiraceae bacterium]